MYEEKMRVSPWDWPFQGVASFVDFFCCSCFYCLSCYLVCSCLERAHLLALLYFVFSCVFVSFPCGVLGQVPCQVCYLIVSIIDICLLPYIYSMTPSITGET